MSDPATFELIEFEQVEAGPGTALLRVAAHPSPAAAVGPLTLVVDDGGQTHRHPQLPSLPGPPTLIRAAFAAPVGHVGRGASFALELADGTLIKLPAPSRRRATGVGSLSGAGGASRAQERGAAHEQADAARLADAERRAEARRLALGELERRLQAEKQRRHAVEADIAQLRSEREQAIAERDGALAERDEATADREAAEGRARAVAAGAGRLEAELRAQADAAESAQQALRAQLAEREAEADRYRAVAELAQARAHTGRLQSAELDEQLVHAQAQISVLEATLDERGKELGERATRAEEALTAVRAESVQTRARMEDLQRELEALRDRSRQISAQRSYESETAQARLDAAHAELEVAHSEIDALRQRCAELEATAAGLDGVLSARAAEIEVLRDAVLDAREQVAGTASVDSGEQLRPEFELLIGDQLVGARAEAELLREQALAQRQQLAELQASLDAHEGRARLAEAARVARDAEFDQLRLQADELNGSLSSAQRTLREASEAITVHEADHRALRDALRTETERRVRAEEALVTAGAERALIGETLALEAGARERLEVRARRLSDEREHRSPRQPS